LSEIPPFNVDLFYDSCDYVARVFIRSSEKQNAY
jgi:hypothetical protein